VLLLGMQSRAHKGIPLRSSISHVEPSPQRHQLVPSFVLPEEANP
jgi:hypothetical protein